MRRLLTLASLGEAGTGLVLFAFPTFVARVLFGSEVAGTGVAMSRLAAIALVGLGVACWPRNPPRQQTYGMLVYSTLAMLYLIAVGFGEAPIGPLLWPAVVVHGVLVVALVAVRVREAGKGGV